MTNVLSKEAESNSLATDTEEKDRKIKVGDRQNSFKATRNFFASQGGGLIISPKEYKKDKSKGTNDSIQQQNDDISNAKHKLSNK